MNISFLVLFLAIYLSLAVISFKSPAAARTQAFRSTGIRNLLALVFFAISSLATQLIVISSTFFWIGASVANGIMWLFLILSFRDLLQLLSGCAD